MTRLAKRFCLIVALIGTQLLALGPNEADAQTAAPTLTELQGLADSGDVAAQYALGLRYHDGNGVVQDFAKAASLFEKAASQGDILALNHLGRYLFEGLGVAQDLPLARRLLQQAAVSGDPQFVFDYALVLEQSEDSLPQAAEQYAQAANAGHQEAAVNLGSMYQEGRGVAQDFDKARQLYEPAAEQGHARAMNNLGMLYVRGDGVAQDYPKAAGYFKSAAELGLAPAMRNLGVLYSNGFGVPVDEAFAEELFRLAGGGAVAEEILDATPDIVYDTRLLPVDSISEELTRAAKGGDPLAQFQVAWVLMSAEGRDFERARTAAILFRSAAERGYGPAMTNLGVMYFEGWGLPQDYVLGLMWLTLAKSTGQPDAARYQDSYSRRVTVGQTNESQTLASTWAQNQISLPVIEVQPK